MNVKTFWEAEARDLGHTPLVTIRDFYFRIHELHILLPLIPQSDRLLDVGCGTGFGTMVLARRSKSTIGIDYSPTMIEQASQLKRDTDRRRALSHELSSLWNLEVSDHSEIEFLQGDLLQLDLSVRDFDVITGQRILINLCSHAEQMKAVENLRGHARDDTRLFLVEATAQGHQRTDQFRAACGLSKLEKYWHNSYLDEDQYPNWERHGFKVETVLSFETYMLLSKVVYPAACGEANCQFLSGANRAAMELASVFRTRSAVQEVGLRAFFDMYVDRVGVYDQRDAEKIRDWVKANGSSLPDWSKLGHQSLIIARAS